MSWEGLSVQVLPEIDITLHDGVEQGLVDLGRVVRLTKFDKIRRTENVGTCPSNATGRVATASIELHSVSFQAKRGQSTPSRDSFVLN